MVDYKLEEWISHCWNGRIALSHQKASLVDGKPSHSTITILSLTMTRHSQFFWLDWKLYLAWQSQTVKIALERPDKSLLEIRFSSISDEFISITYRWHSISMKYNLTRNFIETYFEMLHFGCQIIKASLQFLIKYML